MARRGLTVVFTLIGVALVVSIAGFVAMYLAVRPRARACRPTPRSCCASAATWPRSRRPTSSATCAACGRRPCARSSTTCARRRWIRASARVLLQADRLRLAVLGQGAGDPRRGPRLPEVGEAGVRVPRVRRRSRVLPGDGGRQGLPHAVGVARSGRHRHLRAVPARHARQDRRRTPTCTTSATTRPRSTRSPKRASRRRTRRWTSR